jgi:type II restriction enzyme
MLSLQCNLNLRGEYRSKSQIARVLTEDWCARTLYCAGCKSDELTQSRANTPGLDFNCENCGEAYQLKSSSRAPKAKIVDSAYSAMINAIRSDRVPNLLALHYSPNWTVSNLLLIPRFSYSESAIEKRQPLSVSARRAGWTGCNILLSQIPPSGIIHVIVNGVVAPKSTIRDAFRKMKPLADLRPDARGWTLDVLRVVERLPRQFSLSEVYAHEDELAAIHPGNRHVRDKIRQQLQVLRDLRYIRFEHPGIYLRIID